MSNTLPDSARTRAVDPHTGMRGRSRPEDEYRARVALDKLASAVFEQCAPIAHEGGDLPYDDVLAKLARKVLAKAGVDSSVLDVYLRIDEIPAKAREKTYPLTAAPQRKPMSPRKAIEVFARDGFRCVYCEATRELQVDHITPVARGGTDALDNLQTLCRSCNQAKGAR